MKPGLPEGFGVAFDADATQLDERTLFGGSRVLRLSATGQRALAELRSGPVRTPQAAALARKLVDSGLAHPRPPQLVDRPDVTVLIPVKDRAEYLARCLQSLHGGFRVVVVDDASADPGLIAKVCAEHGVELIRREVNGGPAAARNAGLAAIDSEFVAFLDSDCVATPDWIARLSAHLADPVVGAAAPRLRAIAADTVAGRYTSARGSLDLGPREAAVAPMSRVSYVPTAALVARRQALLEVARDGAVFDESLRFGEDVDLIWRLRQFGCTVRYDPAVEVAHVEPQTWPALLGRRFRYGTSAGPLARRHPEQLAPLVLYPWPTLAVVGLLARRPWLASAGAVASVVRTRRSLKRARLPMTVLVPGALTSARQTWLGLGQYGTQFALPAVVALAARRNTRLAGVALLLGPGLMSWLRRRPQLDPARFTLACLADDAAYGAGVWTGAWQARTALPLQPQLVRSWSTLRNESDGPRLVRDCRRGAAAREEETAGIGVCRAGRGHRAGPDPRRQRRGVR